MQTTIFLAATDHARTSDLYDRLGLTLDSSRRRPGAPSTYVAAKLQTAARTDMPPALFGRLVLLVDDLDVALAEVAAVGGRVLLPATTTGAGRVALVADPDDNVLGLTDTPR